ncbi:hypothetical protein TNCV_1476941 [Trichonephila clavipes]|nr:hypothetical protein TNCV_1476941 [Trichonephila clavipes]
MASVTNEEKKIRSGYLSVPNASTLSITPKLSSTRDNPEIPELAVNGSQHSHKNGHKIGLQVTIMVAVANLALSPIFRQVPIVNRH